MLQNYVTDTPNFENNEDSLKDISGININSDSNRKKSLPKGTIRPKIIESIRYKDSETNTILDSTNFPSIIGFTSSSERFENNNNNIYANSFNENPGPGSYNCPSSFKNSFQSFSSKGYLNGFLSKENRFDKRDGKLFYEKFNPGPGDYQLFKFNSLYEKMKKSLIGKNLFHENTNLNTIEEKKPNPCTYDPKKPISESYKQDNLFNSKIKRFKVKYNNNPGPGTYYLNKNNKKKSLSESAAFKKPIEKKKDILKHLRIKTENEINLEFLDNKFNKDVNKNIFDLSKTRDEYFKRNYSNNLKDQKIKILKFDLGENIDTKDIKPYEFTNYNPKEEKMKLASPRWKENKYAFKTPGPAYYRIRPLEKHLSFNRNEKIFNSSPGIIYTYYQNNNIY